MSEDIVERRMSAYYYEFTPTNVDAIDKILSAVACAGKAFHHTEQWTEEAGAAHDHTGGAPIEWIQNAAREAADEIERLRSKLKALEVIAEEMSLALDAKHDQKERMLAAIPDAFLDGDEEVKPEDAIRDMAKDLARAQFNIQRVNALAASLEATHAKLTEALRLMEPVACPVDGDDPVLVNDDDARAIADFVTRMRGAPNE